MKAVREKLHKLSFQNQSVGIVQLWPWPLTLRPKMYRYLPRTILHLCMIYESCPLKTTQVIVSEVLTKFRCDLDLWPFNPKMFRYLSLTSCIYIWNMKAVRWKLLKLSCQNQSVDGQTWFLYGLSVGYPRSDFNFVSPPLIVSRDSFSYLAWNRFR